VRLGRVGVWLAPLRFASPRRMMNAAPRPSGDPSSVYAQNFKSLGYTDDDLTDGLSDHLIDAIVAWGDETAIARRIHEHLNAGADHVLVHPLTSEGVLMKPEADDLPAAVNRLKRLALATIGTVHQPVGTMLLVGSRVRSDEEGRRSVERGRTK
jgi:hypothetical protein